MIEPRRKRFKSVYDALALVAVLNFVVVGGAVGFFTANGTLNSERVRRAVQALSGTAEPPPVEHALETTNAPTAAEPARAVLSDEDADLMAREAERLKTEIDQRMALANSIMLKVKTEREAFRREQDAVAKQVEADRVRQQDEGFQKQLEILTVLAPKTALGHILALNDPEKAARILAAMDAGRAKKIVESAKRGDELARMKVILQRMESAVPAAGNELRAQATVEP